jgi:predicted dehydrogenase
MWQADVNSGQNPFTVHFGHVVDALRFVAGDFESVRGNLSIAVPEWFETETNHPVTVTAPDNVMLSGRLIGGAVAAVHVAAVPWAGPGFRMQIYGRDGTIVMTNSVSPQRGEASRLQMARDSSELADVKIPDRFNYLTPQFPEGDPFNVGQLYHQFAAAIRTGDNRGPSFDTAVSLHRLLDAVRSSSETGLEVACE